ncbi:MAG: energy transducer TonB [Saprospiraceae bacterium]|nr:energy transducer TonB [Saprospiraceae bacterium]
MKYVFTGLVVMLFLFSGRAQDMGFDIRGVANKTIAKAQLESAEELSDINSDYPSSWIAKEDYVSTEIRMTNDEEQITVVGDSDQLNNAQKEALKKADLGTFIDFEIKYKKENSITKKEDVAIMRFTYSIVPTKEAEFHSGYDKMKAYIKKHAIDKIVNAGYDPFEMARIRFVVNEEGKAKGAYLLESSNVEKIDELLLETIARMPRWIPAEDTDKNKVKQEFEFVVGSMIGC